MGKYLTIVGFDEEAAKKDKVNILIPEWFMNIRDEMEMKIMMVLFDYMGLDTDIDPIKYICGKTGYTKSNIRRVITIYALMGHIEINELE